MAGSGVSRRTAVWLSVCAGAWFAPLPPAALLLLGRVALACACALVAAHFLASLLPRRNVLDLHKRAVLVTGCSSGFGLETALALDRLGVPVFAACLDVDEAGARDLRARASSNVTLLHMDVTSDASVAAAASLVGASLGDRELWAVVNNAGVLAVGEALWMDDAAARAAVEVNAFAHARVVRAFLPLLRQSRGRVVNQLSISCRVTIAGLTPYVMSKGASLALSRALRLELRRFGVSVHTIEAAPYRTPMTDSKDKMITQTWAKCPQNIKEMYGARYGEKFKNVSDLFGIFAKPASKIPIVIDAVIDACFSQDPQEHYVPSFTAKVVTLGATLFPWTVSLVHALVLPSIHKGRQREMSG